VLSYSIRFGSNFSAAWMYFRGRNAGFSNWYEFNHPADFVINNYLYFGDKLQINTNNKPNSLFFSAILFKGQDDQIYQSKIFNGYINQVIFATKKNNWPSWINGSNFLNFIYGNNTADWTYKPTSVIKRFDIFSSLPLYGSEEISFENIIEEINFYALNPNNLIFQKDPFTKTKEQYSVFIPYGTENKYSKFYKNNQNLSFFASTHGTFDNGYEYANYIIPVWLWIFLFSISLLLLLLSLSLILINKKN
jgi:hypothetical protein